MGHAVCFEAGRFTQIQSSWTALSCSRKRMSGPANALTQFVTDRKRQIGAQLVEPATALQESSPLSAGEVLFSLDKSLSWMSPVSPRVYTRWENGDATPLFGTVVKIGDILDVSLDELAGRKESGGEAKIHNHELHRLYKKVDQLSDEDQKALAIVLDSLVKRSRVSWVMAET